MVELVFQRHAMRDEAEQSDGEAENEDIDGVDEDGRKSHGQARLLEC